MLVLKGISDVIDKLNGTKVEVKRALRNSVNASASFARKTAIQKISTETGLSAKAVRSRLRQENSKQDNFSAKVFAIKSRIPLREYKHTISFSGSRGTISADISMLRGNQVVEARAFANPASSKLWRRKGAKAYPISQASGPSVEHHWNRASEELTTAANDELINFFVDKLQKQIQKRK